MSIANNTVAQLVHKEQMIIQTGKRYGWDNETRMWLEMVREEMKRRGVS